MGRLRACVRCSDAPGEKVLVRQFAGFFRLMQAVSHYFIRLYVSYSRQWLITVAASLLVITHNLL